jgi:hypothetical protein
MIRWVILDETGGAPCANGEVLSPSSLARLAAAATLQLNRDVGVDSSVRAGSGPTDVQPGERVFTFRPGLPEAPGALAYHAVDGSGVEFGAEDITGCSSLFGPGSSALAALTHETNETEWDRGCNQWLDDLGGKLHAKERCDAIEVQTYDVGMPDGQPAFVSNFLLDAWTIPNAPGPYTWMGANGLPGAVEPPGPMQTAPGQGGNYQSVETAPTGDPGQVTAMRRGHRHVEGMPSRPAKVAHWSSRTYRRLHGRG